jgi:hypothetical protein
MRQNGTDNIREVPAEQQFTYQRLGFMYLGPVEEPTPPAPNPKPTARKK